MCGAEKAAGWRERAIQALAYEAGGLALFAPLWALADMSSMEFAPRGSIFSSPAISRTWPSPKPLKSLPLPRGRTPHRTFFHQHPFQLQR